MHFKEEHIDYHRIKKGHLTFGTLEFLRRISYFQYFQEPKHFIFLRVIFFLTVDFSYHDWMDCKLQLIREGITSSYKRSARSNMRLRS